MPAGQVAQITPDERMWSLLGCQLGLGLGLVLPVAISWMRRRMSRLTGWVKVRTVPIKVTSFAMTLGAKPPSI